MKVKSRLEMAQVDMHLGLAHLSAGGPVFRFKPPKKKKGSGFAAVVSTKPKPGDPAAETASGTQQKASPKPTAAKAVEKKAAPKSKLSFEEDE